MLGRKSSPKRGSRVENRGSVVIKLNGGRGVVMAVMAVWKCDDVAVAIAVALLILLWC